MTSLQEITKTPKAPKVPEMNADTSSTCRRHIPGIMRLRYVKCALLPPNVMLKSLCGLPIALSIPAVDISFYGVPTLSCDGTKVNGQRQEKSTLEFVSGSTLPENEHIAFVVSCASGITYLIGAREARYPVIEYTDTTGSPGGDSAVRRYKITHLAQKSVLACIL